MKNINLWVVAMSIALITYACKQNASSDTHETPKQDVEALRKKMQEQVAGKMGTFGKEKLSEYGFYEGDLKQLKPAKDLIPYELNTPLFTDYAHKLRFIRLPKGAKMTFHPTEVLDMPVGTQIIKNFYYPSDFRKPEGERRIIETRILEHEKDGWVTLPSYIWNEEQTEAFISLAGGNTSVFFTNELGEKKEIAYVVPSQAQCKSCHVKNNIVTPIGPKARQLNRDFVYAGYSGNQLQHYAKAGLLEGLPTDMSKVMKSPVWNKPETGSLQSRSLAYLDMNCGHCHRPEGPGNTSALHLTELTTNEFNLGINKHPIAAGKGSGNRSYDIVKGKPDESIMTYRMESTNPGIMMPEVGRTTVHTEGVALIKEWIASLK